MVAHQHAEPRRGEAGDVRALEAIRCTSVTNCWGVGDYGMLVPTSNTLFNEVLRWNGRKWRNVTVPSPGKLDDGSTLSGLNFLSCTSAESCWAVGSDTGTSRFRNESLHWNGRNWLTVGTPNPASGSDAFNVLEGVWSLVTVPEPGGTATRSDNSLVAVRCV